MTLDFVSLCRTWAINSMLSFVVFKLTCRYLRNGSFSLSNTNTQTSCACYAVASVLTPPQYRHKGYASHMMRLVHWAITPEEMLKSSLFPKQWGTPPKRSPTLLSGLPVLFSVLYSDVGDTFYANCGPTGVGGGWQPTNSVATTINAQ